MQPIPSFLEGRVLLLDKPLDWTSFDIVKKIRILTKVSKVGHAGTLDPLATGLLIVCTGKFTKKINEYMGMEKEYTGSITLGATTPTYDLESAPVNQQDISSLTEAMLHEATKQFTGDIMQVPPSHSAIKRNGQPVYIAARKGEDVVLEPRPIRISAFTIERIEMPKIYFKVVCSTGTYIRSLAHDYGKALGVGGYLSGLRRTRIGEFSVDDAYTIEQFAEEIKAIRALEGQTNTQL
ncbi:MAG: tRNA pseudouridine(55) synthase TruB [Chitinophagales bacterium]|nr:tRNA pseudouridine(55) synthase TruB [Chitinophagales bacterium]